MDDSLLGQLFAKQGLQTMAVPPALQSEFDAAARLAQKQVEKLAPPGTLERVAVWLGEYRSSHRNDKR